MIEKTKGIQLTKRDMEIIRFINEFGFCEMPQIERQFGIKKPLSYRLVRRLIRAGLIIHQRIFHSTYGIYYVTAQGAKCTDLPPLGTISLGRYEHQQAVTNVFIQLQRKYPDTNWISERRLKHEKYFQGVGKKGHLSDGMLVFSDGKQIAIEIELSLKGKERINRILKSYGTTFSINEVWYFCPKGMIAALSALAAKLSFVKIYNLEEVLHE